MKITDISSQAAKLFTLVSVILLLTTIQALAANENLEEAVARKTCYGTNGWPTTQLEDPSNHYIWQPETLAYQDLTTGHEVWVLVHAPDQEEIYSKEHGTNVWSYDGSRVGFFSTQRPTANPYGTPYFGHPVFDRWGKYALVGTYTDNPKPGTRIYNMKTNALEPNYVLAYNKYDGQHHSWTGWTDYVIGVNPYTLFLMANKYTDSYKNAFQIADMHYPGYAGNYNSYPRPSQSPDGTKVAFQAVWLNNNGDRFPYICWAVVYYPHPSVNVRVSKNGSLVHLTWERPSYTTRGWPDEATDPPPGAEEIKGYHVWASPDGETGWTELTADAVATESYDTPQTNNTTVYYAVTSEEYSRLESRRLSEVRRVTLDGNGNLTDSQYAPEGKTGFWTTPPPAPTPSSFTISAGGPYRLSWSEPNNSKIRYYNIYYSATGAPPVDRRYRIASVPVGTTTYLDWLADTSQPGYYTISSVDRQGNEGGSDLPDGDINLDGTVDIADALLALRIVIGTYSPSVQQFVHGDVAPLVGGAPAPDGIIDTGDVLAIMRNAVGLISS